MQVSTRISYPDAAIPRPRAAASRPWTGDPVPPVRADERGGGYRGTLSRGSHQQVNDRPAGASGDKQVFVARSLSSTLAMLQMHVVPDAESASDLAVPPDLGSSADRSFVDDLFSGVLSPRQSQ